MRVRKERNLLRVVVARWGEIARESKSRRVKNRKALRYYSWAVSEKCFRGWTFWFRREKERRVVETEKYIRRRVEERVEVCRRGGVEGVKSLVGEVRGRMEDPARVTVAPAMVAPVVEVDTWKGSSLAQPRRAIELMMEEVREEARSGSGAVSRQEKEEEKGRGIPSWIVEEMNKRFEGDYGRAQNFRQPVGVSAKEVVVQPVVEILYSNGPPWMTELPKPRTEETVEETTTVTVEETVEEAVEETVEVPPGRHLAPIEEGNPAVESNNNLANSMTTTTSSVNDDDRSSTGEEPSDPYSGAVAPASPPQLAYRIQTAPEHLMLSPMSATSQAMGGDVEAQLSRLEGRLDKIREEKASRKGKEGYMEWKEKTRGKLEQVLRMINDIKSAQHMQEQQQ